MKKGKKSIVTVILAFILAVAGGVVYDNEQAPAQDTVQETVVLPESMQEDLDVQEDLEEPAQGVELADEPELTFRKENNLTSHYEKHGMEMGFASPEEYLAAANAVVNNPDSLHKLEAEDGDDVYYLEATNEFVVVSKDGYIRTYFNPSGGIDYFNRQ